MDCLPGKIAKNNGASTCTDCPAGSFAMDVTKCVPCLSGKYQPSTGESSCIITPAEFYSSEGASEPIPCSIGMTSKPGQSECYSCSVGKYLDFNGICTNCDIGKYNSISGLTTSCIVCPAGKYASVEGSELCLDCEPGKFQKFTGSSSCTVVNMGSFTSNPGSIEPTECFMGTYANVTGLSTCFKCAKGKHNEFLGENECVDCTEDTFADQEGYAICDPCMDGFSSNVGAMICTKDPQSDTSSTLSNISSNKNITTLTFIFIPLLFIVCFISYYGCYKRRRKNEEIEDDTPYNRWQKNEENKKAGIETEHHQGCDDHAEFDIEAFTSKDIIDSNKTQIETKTDDTFHIDNEGLTHNPMFAGKSVRKSFAKKRIKQQHQTVIRNDKHEIELT